MSALPYDIGCVHFVGIGGIGMSGIAEVMHNLGYRVQGSDQARNANVQRLETMGVRVFQGHAADNLTDAKVCVVSSAIGPDNAEMVEARHRGIPLVRRAEMLAELMRLKWCVSVAGTHGKTTTTSMVGAVLAKGGVDPTIINGGIINQYGTNARLGTSDWMVVEADESDGTFVKLPATIAVVTNLDPEHLDFYGDFDTEKSAFKQFLDRVPFYGAAILCVDHPEVQGLIPDLVDRKVITYGLSPLADIQAFDIKSAQGGSQFNVRVRPGLLDHLPGKDTLTLDDVHLPLPGSHNIQNALAAIAVALQMRLDPEDIRRAFEDFKGVKRRFTRVGSFNGTALIDDYGHHPTEIAATLDAARDSFSGRIIAVVQPHRFSRLASLWDDFATSFNAADHVICTPVFAAGEEPITGISHETLADRLRDFGHRSVAVAETMEDIADQMAPVLRDGDCLIFLGAGSITKWAEAMPNLLITASTEPLGGAL